MPDLGNGWILEAPAPPPPSSTDLGGGWSLSGDVSTPVPGMEKLGGTPPGPPKPPLPTRLSPTATTAQQYDIAPGPVDTSLEKPYTGLVTALGGVEKLAPEVQAAFTAPTHPERLKPGPEPLTPALQRQGAEGLHEIASGAFEAAKPLVLPALLTSPLGTVGTIAAITAGGKLTEAGLRSAGVAPEYAALGGDVVALAAAGGGLRYLIGKGDAAIEAHNQAADVLLLQEQQAGRVGQGMQDIFAGDSHPVQIGDKSATVEFSGYSPKTGRGAFQVVGDDGKVLYAGDGRTVQDWLLSNKAVPRRTAETAALEQQAGLAREISQTAQERSEAMSARDKARNAGKPDLYAEAAFIDADQRLVDLKKQLAAQNNPAYQPGAPPPVQPAAPSAIVQPASPELLARPDLGNGWKLETPPSIPEPRAGVPAAEPVAAQPDLGGGWKLAEPSGQAAIPAGPAETPGSGKTPEEVQPLPGDIQTAADTFAKTGPISKIYSSALPHTQQAAQQLAELTGAPVTHEPAFQGGDAATFIARQQEEYAKNPDQRIVYVTHQPVVEGEPGSVQRMYLTRSGDWAVKSVDPSNEKEMGKDGMFFVTHGEMAPQAASVEPVNPTATPEGGVEPAQRGGGELTTPVGAAANGQSAGLTLYHGYSTADADAINKTGLVPGTFLTDDPEYANRAALARARMVGGEPAVLAVAEKDAGPLERIGAHPRTTTLIRPEKFQAPQPVADQSTVPAGQAGGRSLDRSTPESKFNGAGNNPTLRPQSSQEAESSSSPSSIEIPGSRSEANPRVPGPGTSGLPAVPTEAHAGSPRTDNGGSGVGDELDKLLTEAPDAKKHDYASTQVNLQGEIANAALAFGKTIPKHELASEEGASYGGATADTGLETEPHITVKYGLHGDDPQAVAARLKEEPPITATLGKASIFPSTESGSGDVLKVDVESPDLHRLNQKIAQLPHTDTHPTYQPHLTIAYLKPGEGQKYVGKSIPGVTGQKITLDKLAFSDKSGEQTEIQLKRRDRARSPAIEKGLAAWSDSRLYIDGQGNYHLRPEGKKTGTGPIAPWNKELKAAFKTSSDLHAAANARRIAEVEKQLAEKRTAAPTPPHQQPTTESSPGLVRAWLESLENRLKVHNSASDAYGKMLEEAEEYRASTNLQTPSNYEYADQVIRNAYIRRNEAVAKQAKAKPATEKPKGPPITERAATVDFGKEHASNGRREMTARGVNADGAPTGEFVVVRQNRNSLWDVEREFYQTPPGEKNRYGHQEKEIVAANYPKAEARQAAEAFLKGEENPFAKAESGLPMSDYKKGNGKIDMEGVRFGGGLAHGKIDGEEGWSDGHVLFVSKPPGELSANEKQPNMQKQWDDSKTAKTAGMPVGFYRAHGQNNVVLSSGITLAGNYFDYAKKTFPDTAFLTGKPGDPIVVKSGGKMVGIVMPLRMPADELPAGIQALLKPAAPPAKPAKAAKTSKVPPAVQQRRDVFTPGNVVTSYGGGRDRVLKYEEGVNSFGHPEPHSFRVQVQEIDKEGRPLGLPRWHSTQPDRSTKAVASAPLESPAKQIAEADANAQQVSAGEPPETAPLAGGVSLKGGSDAAQAVSLPNLLQSWADRIKKRYGFDLPYANYSGLGSFKDIGVRDLSQLEKASPDAYLAAVKTIGSRAYAQVLNRSVAPKIKQALKGSGISYETFRTALVESRLRGIRQRWTDLAESARSLDTPEAATQSYNGGLRGLLEALEGRRGMDDFLKQDADAMLANEDIPSLAEFLGEIFDRAAANVGTMSFVGGHPGGFAGVTADPHFRSALAIYKDLIEKPLAENHAQNEGVFSDAVGPLDTYYPLIPVAEEDRAMFSMGRRAPYRKPRNAANQFATGLGEYTVAMDAFGDRIRSAIRANNKAAMLETVADQGLMLPVEKGQEVPTTEMPDGRRIPVINIDGRDFPASVVQVKQDRTVYQNGEAVHLPGKRMLVPDWLRKELEPVLESSEINKIPNLASRVIGAINSFALAGPLDFVFHTTNVLGTLLFKTPFAGTGILSKTIGNTPVTKLFTAIANTLRQDPETPESIEKLLRMARLGLIPGKFGRETYSKRIAEETGAELRRLPMMGPMLFGPNGLDIRSRLLMYDIAHEINPNVTDKELIDFVRALGSYNRELEGRIERFVKEAGLGPFATAGSTMYRNSIQAWTGGGALPKAAPWNGRLEPLEGVFPRGAALRLASMLSGAALGLIALWAVAYKATDGKWPWEDPNSRLLQIPVPDSLRHSQFGNAIWGPTGKTGMIDLGFFSPLVVRGSRTLGLSGMYNAGMAGASFGQMTEAAQRDMLNSLAHPLTSGPMFRAGFVTAFGTEPYVTGLRDRRTGKFGPQFRPAIATLPAGLPTAGARVGEGLLNINSFWQNVAGSVGLGQKARDSQEDQAARWLRTITDVAAPRLLGQTYDVNATRRSLSQERRATARAAARGR